MRWIPAARSRHWLITIMPASSIVLVAMLWLIRFGVLGQAFTAVHALRFALLALALCAAAGIAGWLGARILWVTAMLGTLAGLIYMAIAYQGDTGWEDLAGLLGFMQLAVLGFAVGIIAELAAALLRLKRRS